MIRLIDVECDEITVDDVARYFIEKSYEEPPYNITHLKLHKLTYYALGWYSALESEYLFKEEAQAWKYGPCFPSLYEKYKKYGAGTIPKYPFNKEKFNTRRVKILNSVWNVYGKYGPIELMERNHSEDPWLYNYDPTNERKKISHEDIKTYFAKLVKEHKKEVTP